MSSLEDMLEEQAWRAREGLDDLAWDPDAVAPPMLGGVYEREAQASELMKVLGRLAFLAALLCWAAFMWRA